MELWDEAEYNMAQEHVLAEEDHGETAARRRETYIPG